MKTIPLTKGYYALVDEEDYEFLMQWKWYASARKNTVYPMRHVKRGGNDLWITLASQIMGTPSNIEIDHKDRNGLNAQRSNLRIASKSEQGSNKWNSANTTGYKGVIKRPYPNRWYAQIIKDGRNIYLGSFDNPQKAAEAYDAAAQELFGEYALTNRKMGRI